MIKAPSHLIYLQATGTQPSGENGKCVFCGTSKYPIQEEVGKVVSGNFTAWSTLHEGVGVCKACYYALKTPDYRRYSFLITEHEFRVLNSENTVDALLNPPDEPFVIVITTSHKKHLWPGVVVNSGKGPFTVRFDEANILWEPETCKLYLEKVQLLREILTRDEILFLTPKANKLGKMEQRHWDTLAFLREKGLKNTNLLKLLAFVAKKEVKDG